MKLRVALLLAVAIACRTALSKEAAIADCRVAKPAYGDDLAACLAVRHHWTASDAAFEAQVEQAREWQRRYYLGLLPYTRPQAYLETRRKLVATGMATRLADSIVSADSAWVAHAETVVR